MYECSKALLLGGSHGCYQLLRAASNRRRTTLPMVCLALPPYDSSLFCFTIHPGRRPNAYAREPNRLNGQTAGLSAGCAALSPAGGLWRNLDATPAGDVLFRGAAAANAPARDVYLAVQRPSGDAPQLAPIGPGCCIPLKQLKNTDKSHPRRRGFRPHEPDKKIL